MGTSSMHYVRYSTESRGIMSVTPDLESHAVSHGTDRSTNPIKVSNDFIYQLFGVIKFTIIVISCNFGFHLFSNQKWHSNQCCVVNEKKCQFSFFFSTLSEGSRIGGVRTTHLDKNNMVPSLFLRMALLHYGVSRIVTSQYYKTIYIVSSITRIVTL